MQVDLAPNEMEESFLNWLVTYGSILSPKIQFCNDDSQGRGVIATDDIDTDEDLFFIPYDCCIYADPNDEMINEHEWLPLMIKIYNECRLDNYQPYLQLIPQVDCPMTWTDEEQKLVELILPIGSEESLQLFHKLNEFVDCSIEEFYFIGCFIMAYSFSYSYIVMIPMADMLNHHSQHNCQLFEVEGGYAMRAIQPIPAGCELYNTYGGLSNIDLLLKYGFVEQHNPYEQGWLNEYLGLQTHAEDEEQLVEYIDVEDEQLGELENDEDVDLQNPESMDLEAANDIESDKGMDARSEVVEYMEALDLILQTDLENDRIGKLQYIAGTHKQLLGMWLESGQLIEE